MKVLVGPSIDLVADAGADSIARALAGPDSEITSLAQVGVKNLSRPLTRAEVALLRGVLGDQDESGLDSDEHGGSVAYVCRGMALREDSSCGNSLVVAVTDHVNLTWRSPLRGRNDDDVGPRFPSMTGIYASELVAERLKAEGGIIVRPGVVLGVDDPAHLNAYESGSVRVDRHLAASSELVPIAIIAAHMGLRIAAAVTA